MNLNLTHQEHALLLDSIFARIKQIDKLLESFEEPKLIEIYSKDKEMLIILQNKIESQYETETI